MKVCNILASIRNYQYLQHYKNTCNFSWLQSVFYVRATDKSQTVSFRFETNTGGFHKSRKSLVYQLYERFFVKKYGITEATMKIVNVTVVPNDSIYTITLHTGNNKRVFNRPLEEMLDRTIARMTTTLNPQNKKGLPPKKLAKLQGASNFHDSSGASDLKISLFDIHGNEVSLDKKSIDAWKVTKVLQINGDKYSVIYNPPAITHIGFFIPLATMSIYPKLQFSHSSPDQSRFVWYRSKEKKPVNDSNTWEYKNDNVAMEVEETLSIGDLQCNSKNNSNLVNASEWEEIACTQTYTPTLEDVGYKLMLTVLPGNETYPNTKTHLGVNMITATSDVVRKGPDICIFNERLKMTKGDSKSSVRVVCYNILADCYADTETAQTTLFPYCPSKFINIKYRIQLLQKELEGYQGDILCLQEVDQWVYQDYLNPNMALQNYSSCYGGKQHVNEGVALFYNRSKFKLLSVVNKVLKDSLQKDEVNQSLLKLVENNKKFKSRVVSRGSCVLLAVLQSVQYPSRHLVVANTHLYFHPRALHVRNAQIAVILNLVEETVNSLQEKMKDDAVISYMVCGDLNSNPRCGVIEYLSSGNLSFQHADWYSSGIEEYHGTNLSLSHDLKLTSAGGFPCYTNYVAGFADCLDYIFVNPNHFKVNQVLPNPSHELVVRHTALPSEISPSDHIAQVVDLTWLPQDSA